MIGLRSIALAYFAVVSSPLSSAVQESYFAILCEGSSEFTNLDGRPKKSEIGPQVFVIDSNTRAVFRALKPLQIFDPVCGVQGVPNKANISPGMITLFSYEQISEGNYSNCSMLIDRKLGTAEYRLKLDFKSGTSTLTVWKMTCQPTSIPKFDTSRNKF